MVSQRGLGGLPHERLQNPEGGNGEWVMGNGEWGMVSQRGLLPKGEASAKGSQCVGRLRRQSRTWRGLPHERLQNPEGGNGEWGMGNGAMGTLGRLKRIITDVQCPMPNYPLPITNYPLPITKCYAALGYSE
jgi:hypothetical protein